jgi:Hg(II)-responsive transcriptional regulator
MTIGEVAERAGVNVQTVRYYERRGLLPEPPRSGSGYRQYEPEAVARIQFIKRAQLLGFSLVEITELLSLRIKAGSNCDEVQRKAEAKRREIDEKIVALDEMKRSLDRLIRACESREPTEECPILARLEN